MYRLYCINDDGNPCKTASVIAKVWKIVKKFATKFTSMQTYSNVCNRIQKCEQLLKKNFAGVCKNIERSIVHKVHTSTLEQIKVNKSKYNFTL